MNCDTIESKNKLLSARLEIFIITYNRSPLLAKTLDQLGDSPFSNCKITVLDNCSKDETVSVVNSKKYKFCNFNIVTHKINIGASANILRAIELSEGLYTWLLCDDDNYDFSDCSDVIDAVINEEYDLIHMGAHKEFWKYGTMSATPKELIKIGYPYFKYSSFLPCNLFRTERFQKTINTAYENIVNWYPHMPFLVEFFNNEDKIYISKNQIVTASISYSGFQGVKVMKKWSNLTELLIDRRYKLIFILNQGLMVKENNSPSINRALISYGINVLCNRNFSVISRLLQFAGIWQILILTSSVLLSPVWYVNRKLLLKNL
jgi:glycosyltransferase involved in cell wall biosynthesis